MASGFGRNVLINAIISGVNLEEFKRLIASGADVNERRSGDGNTPLHIACLSTIRNPLLVKILIDAGADVKVANERGETPLLFAARSHPSIVKALIEKGANVNVLSNYGEHPLTKAVYHCSDNSAESFANTTLLIKAGADVNLEGNERESPLYFAAKEGCDKLVKLLLSAGADIFAEAYETFSVLEYAEAGYFKPHIVKLILDDVPRASFERRKHALAHYYGVREEDARARELERARAGAGAGAGAGGPTVEPADGGRRKRRATRSHKARKLRKGTRSSRR